ncbi:hypothetical protein ESZ36_20210 [Colwellia demingiae]|uniref:Uncharacterized protein n=1 Tax=Colwellia demingiae TaxID=89401 RepID=A0A5C6Q6H1_9GAMM|nr:hypothetical protein [Colwellia demingiae]TWX64301.1 hypothetical protein ESZ36_20210 [Colwellia demingiae]
MNISSIINLMIILILLSGCAGKEEARQLVQAMQTTNKESAKIFSQYMHSAQETEFKKQQSIEQVLVLLEQERSVPVAVSNNCFKAVSQYQVDLSLAYNEQVSVIIQNLFSGKLKGIEEIDESLKRLENKLAEIELSMKDKRNRIRSGEGTQEIKDDLSREKNTYLATFMFYSIQRDAAVEEVSSKFDELTKNQLAKLTKEYDSQLLMLNQASEEKCLPTERQQAQISAQKNVQIKAALQEIGRANNAEFLSQVDKQVVGFMLANVRAASSLETYIDYNSLGSDSGVMELFKSLPGNIFIGAINPSSATNIDDVKSQSLALGKDLQGQLSKELVGFKSSLKDIASETTGTASSNITSLITNKLNKLVNEKLDKL